MTARLSSMLRRPATVFLVSLALSLGLAELAARRFFANDRRGFETQRRLLAAEAREGPQFQNSIGLPYLVYAPVPSFSDGPNFHNAQGFRGRPVPFERRAEVARIVCLGGSTTYGWGVQDPAEAYPAQLERRLAANLPEGFAGVEVLNAGLPWGTSAEMLTHYHFKYHYFRPDIVIINEGGNDGQAASRAYYQPDYSHWRKPLQTTTAWTPLGRALLKSRLLAWGLLVAMAGPRPGSVTIQIPDGDLPAVRWYPTAITGLDSRAVPDAELAFVHNIRSLVAEVRADKAVPILVPFRIAPRFVGQVPETEQTLRNERVLRQIATDQSELFAPFPAEVIGPDNWVDDCHLNAAGERQKAEHLEPFVRQALQQLRATQALQK